MYVLKLNMYRTMGDDYVYSYVHVMLGFIFATETSY